MAFFGLAWKRKRGPQAKPPLRPPADALEADETADSTFVVSRPGAGHAAAPQSGVEVSELSLDQQDFESTFGSSSLFDEGEQEPSVRGADPWARLLRRD